MLDEKHKPTYVETSLRNKKQQNILSYVQAHMCNVRQNVNEEKLARTYVANSTRETKRPNTLTIADIGKYEVSNAHKKL